VVIALRDCPSPFEPAANVAVQFDAATGSER